MCTFLGIDKRLQGVLDFILGVGFFNYVGVAGSVRSYLERKFPFPGYGVCMAGRGVAYVASFRHGDWFYQFANRMG